MNEFRIHDLPTGFDPHKDKLPFTVVYKGGCFGQVSVLYLLSLTIFLPILFSIQFEVRLFNLINIYFIVMFTGITIFAIVETYKYIRALLKWYPLVRHGILIPGYIVKAGSGTKSPPGAWRKLPAHNINFEVIYGFQTPSGENITGEVTRLVNRFSLPRHFPQPGTPVTVLYANDNCHIML